MSRETMKFSIPACMIDSLGPQKAVTSAIEYILQDGAEAIVGCLNCTVFPANMKRKPTVIPMPKRLRDWLEVAARNEDAMGSIEFSLRLPKSLLWKGSALPATAENRRAA